jgi:23S rRNA (pseudouridine1915-N3)-methyltransferase
VKLIVVAVGHRMPAWIDAGFAEYSRRMPREVRVELIEIKPDKREGGRSSAQILAAERMRIDAAVPLSARRVVLDERGELLTTAQLADWLKQWMRDGSDAAFVIGSADGVDPELKRGAHRMLSLSRMTLPHGLARVILAEQLYRAVSLLHNHPYHRE